MALCTVFGEICAKKIQNIIFGTLALLTHRKKCFLSLVFYINLFLFEEEIIAMLCELHYMFQYCHV